MRVFENTAVLKNWNNDTVKNNNTQACHTIFRQVNLMLYTFF